VRLSFATLTDCFGSSRLTDVLTCILAVGGDKIIYGTDDGVYFSNLAEPDKKPALVVSLLDVTQVEVLEHPFPLLIVLAERSVQTFPLESLSLQDPTAALKRGKRISSHTTFFKAGLCVGRQLVCIVKSSPLSTTIKTMDPVEAPASKKQQGGAAFSKLKPNRNETLRVFKEFYIPTESSSIHFLKTKLCVGCTKGFEIVDLETLDTQGLLDPADPNLDLVHKRDNQRPVRPIAIYRVEGDFLLCYDGKSMPLCARLLDRQELTLTPSVVPQNLPSTSTRTAGASAARATGRTSAGSSPGRGCRPTLVRPLKRAFGAACVADMALLFSSPPLPLGHGV
jgi:hypothetical protein